jgi:hypothetical protein
MTQVNRRAFLRKLAKGAAYTAPVVYSMSAPVDLIGQGMSSGKGGGKDMDKATGASQTQFVPPPPGSVPPGG